MKGVLQDEPWSPYRGRAPEHAVIIPVLSSSVLNSGRLLRLHHLFHTLREGHSDPIRASVNDAVGGRIVHLIVHTGSHRVGMVGQEQIASFRLRASGEKALVLILPAPRGDHFDSIFFQILFLQKVQFPYHDRLVIPMVCRALVIPALMARIQTYLHIAADSFLSLYYRI